MRRARGSGGRFLNTKKEGNAQGGDNSSVKVRVAKPPAILVSTSPSSEILHSDSGNLNSTSSGSSINGSEVTSMYSRDDPDHFRFINHLRPTMYHRLPDMMDGEYGTGIKTKWGAAVTGGCCDLLNVWLPGSGVTIGCVICLLRAISPPLGNPRGLCNQMEELAALQRALGLLACSAPSSGCLKANHSWLICIQIFQHYGSPPYILS